MWGIPSLPEELLDSEEGLSFLELIDCLFNKVD
jgi:hypothetical protein